MLLEILDLPADISAIVCYVPDMGVLQEIKRYVSRLYAFDQNYTEYITNAADIKRVYRDALVMPLLGDRWYIEMDMDRVNPDNAANIVRNINNNSFSLLYTTRYGVYKKLAESREIASAGNTYFLYGGVLSAKDIYAAYDEICRLGEVPMSEQLLGYVVKNYRYDVSRVLLLIQKMSSGEKFRKRTDIVAAVGLGSISALSFVVDILSSELSSGLKCKTACRRWFQTLRDLLQDISVPELIKQMQRGCEDVYIYKDLQMRGLIIGCRCEAGDEQTEVRIKRLRRFEKRISENVALIRVLWLRRALECPSAMLNTGEERIIKCLYSYMSLWSSDIAAERSV